MISSLFKGNRSKLHSNVLILGSCLLLTLNSCSLSSNKKEEIKKGEVIEMVKSESYFKSTEYNFIKASTTWIKSEANEGSAKFVKQAFESANSIEIGKTKTETDQSYPYFPLVITKEGIESLNNTVVFYKSGKKISYSFTVPEGQNNFLNTNLTVIVKNDYDYSYNEEGYLIDFTWSIVATCDDGTSYTALRNQSLEWLE